MRFSDLIREQLGERYCEREREREQERDRESERRGRQGSQRTQRPMMQILVPVVVVYKEMVVNEPCFSEAGHGKTKKKPLKIARNSSLMWMRVRFVDLRQSPGRTFSHNRLSNELSTTIVTAIIRSCLIVGIVRVVLRVSSVRDGVVG
jgi:hypothetical protein